MWITLASKSMSGHESPAASPGRRPRYSIVIQIASSGVPSAAAMNPRAWSAVSVRPSLVRRASAGISTTAAMLRETTSRRTPHLSTCDKVPARNAGVRLAHFGWYMAIGVALVWIPAWLATRNSAFLIGIVISSIVVSNLFIVVHDTIHRPGSHRLVEAQPWFGFLDRHHYLHHVDLGANLNFLLPLADLLFGSLRTRMTQDEVARHGTLADAKSRPIGEGERARNAVVE